MPLSGRHAHWAQSHGPDGIEELDDFFRGVAEARYVIRRITRIVDEHARSYSIDPLAHQLLIQLFGASSPLSINRLAERLDVSAAVASRLAKDLETRELVLRNKSEIDRRVTDVSLTASGREACVAIWEKAREPMKTFQDTLSDDDKEIALAVFAFYVGAPVDLDGE